MDELQLQTLSTPLFSLEGEEMLGKCVKCYDGDTIHIVFNYKGEYRRFRSRLLEIDTPELRSKNEKEKEIAKEARSKMREWVLDKIVWVKCGGFDKYGRLLVYIYPYGFQMGGNVGDKGYLGSFNERLVTLGIAYRYEGGKKKKFEEWFPVMD